MLFGIAAEGVSMYRNAMEGETAAETARNAAKLRLAEAEKETQLAKKAAAEAEATRAAADKAAKLRLAEAEERTQLAKKAAFEAEMAKAAADNAAKLKLAEAEERLQKSRTAKAEADVSPEMQAATLAAKQAEARKLDGEATKAQFIACAMDVSKCTPEQRCIIEGQDNVGSRIYELNLALTEKLMGHTSFEISRNRKCASLRNATQYDQPQIPPQVPPRCRQLFADWQRFDAHTAFALTNTGNCVWSDGGQPSVETAIADVRGHCWRQNSLPFGPRIFPPRPCKIGKARSGLDGCEHHAMLAARRAKAEQGD